MNIILERSYFPNGTNGEFHVDGKRQCFAIELPWLNNETGKSCIPEGKYKLMRRTSAKYGEHVILCNTSPRELILIHPANNAKKELRGCIAPVTTITGQGTGSESRKAFNPLKEKIYAALKNNEDVWLTITKKA